MQLAAPEVVADGLRAVVVAAGQRPGEPVLRARPRQRRRGDVGQRGHVEPRDGLLELLGDRAVEDRGDDRDVLVEVAHEQREPQRQLVARRHEADDVGAGGLERLLHRRVVRLLAAAHLGAPLLERRLHLLEEVAETGEQDAATLGLGHGGSVPRVAFRR